jgi:hypothetical protein
MSLFQGLFGRAQIGNAKIVPRRPRTGSHSAAHSEADESNIDRKSQTGTPPRRKFAGAAVRLTYF